MKINTLLALILSTVAACAPCAPGEDGSVPQDGAVVADAAPSDASCMPPTTSVVEEGSELVVLQGTDSNGAPFQVGMVRVATSVEVTNSLGAQPHGLALVLNGVRQSTMVWGGRAVGMSRIAATVPQGPFCPAPCTVTWSSSASEPWVRRCLPRVSPWSVTSFGMDSLSLSASMCAPLRAASKERPRKWLCAFAERGMCLTTLPSKTRNRKSATS